MSPIIYKKIIGVVAIVSILASIVPIPNALAEGETDILDALGSSNGRGSLPNVGVTSGGAGGIDAVYVQGVNPLIVESLRAPNVSTAISTAALTGQSFFEWAQTFVLEALKKKILDMIVDDIVRWVQGGGDPKFVTDWKQFLEDAGNVALGELAVKVAGAGICAPFKSSILDNLRVPVQRFSSGGLYGSSITCTLDEIVDNIESFNENFKNGGWAAYSESLKVQNDPIALLVITQNAKFQTIASAQEAAKNEALAGRGYLSGKTCFEDPGSDGPDLDGDKTKGDVASTCRITTPGATIGDLVGKAVGADIDYIVNAQQLAAYVAAIGDALWNRLIHEAAGGLSNVSTDNAPSGDDIIPEGATGCAALGSPSLRDACYAYVESNNNNFGITRDNLIADIHSIRTSLSELREAVVAWKTVADELNAFIAEQAEDKPADCISEALDAHFTNPTPAGVAAYAASINTQLTTIDTRLAALAGYETELNGISTEDPNVWANFTLRATVIQTQLTIFQVAPDATERALAQKGELETALDIDIKPDVLMCH